MKKASILISLVLISVFLYQNCGDPNDGPTSLVGPGNQKNYYFLQTGYQCQTQSGSIIDSYKDHIISSNSQLIVAGDKCNDALQAFPADHSQFIFSNDAGTIQYNGNTYQFMESPPF